jgi:hypothetical protein
MDNNVLQKKDPFPKTVSEACTFMAGWKSKSGSSNYVNKYNEAKKSKPAIETTKRRILDVLNAAKQGITPTNAMKDRQQMKRW